MNESSAKAGESDLQRAIHILYTDLGILLSNKDYVLLLCSFSIGVGFFNALLTLLNQIVNPFGYRYGRREFFLFVIYLLFLHFIDICIFNIWSFYMYICRVLSSNDDAGTFGAVFIVFGLVGAGVIGTCSICTILLYTILYYSMYYNTMYYTVLYYSMYYIIHYILLYVLYYTIYNYMYKTAVCTVLYYVLCIIL